LTGFRIICCAFLSVALSGTSRAQLPYTIRAKIGVDRTSVYRVDFNALKNAGIDPGSIDPRQLFLVTFPTGMLPQANNQTQAQEFVDIYVSGKQDGRFDKEDFIVFYGQGPDRLKYNDSKGLYDYQNNLYSDVNYYFLAATPNGATGVTKVGGSADHSTTITEFADCSVYEQDLYNDLKSGRDWVGEIMDNRPDLTIRFSVPGIVPNSGIKITSSLMAQSYSPSSFKILWNNVQVLERAMPVIPETQYGIKGTKSADTVTTNSTTVNAAAVNDQDIKISFVKGTSGRSVGFLDYIVLNMTRKLAWYGNPTIFTIPATTQASSNLDVSGTPVDAVVWDVTNPYHPIEQTTVTTSTGLRFGSATSTTRTFVTFTLGNVPGPLSIAQPEQWDSDLWTTPDLLIITAPQFKAEADRLAAHRETAYGISVNVVTPGQIYDQYSGGRQDVSAIRNYLRSLYKTNTNGSTPKLSNVLLFGRGSYDYKDRVVNNSNYVPTYESVKSLSPLETYSSDDFFVLLEDHEGEWSESPAANSTLDIGVGRIPVRTAEEAAIVVDKLIAFDTDNRRFGGWRKDILFVADDGDWNIHQSDADELAEDIETSYLRFHTNKLYLDSYEQRETAGGQVSPDASAALDREMNKGYAIVNYSGHGNERVWMDERVLDQNTPLELPNNPRQPLFLTATCEFGRNDNPLLISTAELLLLRKKGGAIGLVTTTRPVHSTTNFFLNKAFYASLFDVDGGAKDLGTLFRETKNKSLSGISNRNFSLLGDPSMKFGLQPEVAVVTDISTATGSDTLKASSDVIVQGEIRLGAGVSSSFNGVVEISLYDKRSNLVTLGDENEPFDYKRWDHLLFRGQATVEQGRFIHSFHLPVNLAPQVGSGKVSLYAVSTDKKTEVLGTMLNVKIGGAEPNPVADAAGPVIELFVGDTTFINGGVANNNTLFIARLSDKNGINTSGYNPQGLTASLDDVILPALNEYYVAHLDDATQGTLTFPLDGLTPGPHRITLQAYDNFNNMSTSFVDFVVGETDKLVIEEFLGYPNPFSFAEPAVFQFAHSRSGEDLEAQLQIYNGMGQLIAHLEYFVASSAYRVTLSDWDGLSSFGTKMTEGIYLAKLSVRSLSDGAENVKITRLILTN
jgi:hypothetical protein